MIRRRIIPVGWLSCVLAGGGYVTGVAAGPAGEQTPPSARASAGALEEIFRHPPMATRPSCYWWWLNNLVDKAGITRDLEEFKAKGLGGVMLVCSGNWSAAAPPQRGPSLLSPEWRELYRHTLKEAARLGLEVSVNFCASGWTMGGPWITPEFNGRWFVQSELALTGPQRFSGKLPRPDPRGGYKPPYMLNVQASMNWPKDKMDYRDNAIVAVRETDKQANLLGEERGKWLDAKSNRKDGHVFIKAMEVMEPTLIPWVTLPTDKPPQPSEVIDLTDRVKSDGSLDWEVPEGKWVVIRTGHVATGAPLSCLLPEMGGALAVDWLNPDAVDIMFKHFGDILLEDAGLLAGKTLKYFHTDSYEDGYPNWTDKLLRKFQTYRGYDPAPYLPVFAGRIIGSAEVSDRFLYDYRKTAADLFADGCYQRLQERTHQHGMLTVCESAGPSWSGTVCMDALKNLGRADVPMGEFWNEASFVENDQNKVGKQTASAAHIYGRRMAAAESFTCSSQWQEAPERLKPVADRAFCEGINRIVFHTMTSTRPADGLPGYEYGAGTHFNPNVTWWKEGAGPWVSYLSRCTALLQSGLFVADVLFYNGDWAPNLVEPKHVDPSLGEGYDYDVCNAEVLLTRLSVKRGRIVLPDGMSYRLLVLPERKSMPVEVVRKIQELVQAGATVVGPRPESDPGLKNYPQCDEVVRKTAAELWGEVDGRTMKERKVGKGRIMWGKSLREILLADGVPPDFEPAEVRDTAVAPANERFVDYIHGTNVYWVYGAPMRQGKRFIDFIHRTTEGGEIYFLANRNARPESGECVFRVQGRQPELWDPVSGSVRELTKFAEKGGRTTVPLQFEPCGSMFVVFRNQAHKSAGKVPNSVPDFTDYKSAQEITGPWTVQFDPQWFYPVAGLDAAQASGKVIFERLEDWTRRPEAPIKHFSGTATYRTAFNATIAPGSKVYLDLGSVKEIAVVRLNGKNLGTIWCHPWRVAITEAVRDGANALEIDVVNLWPNRLIGDAALPVEKRRTRSNVGPNSPVLPSGLLGPVTIQVAQPAMRRQERPADGKIDAPRGWL